MAGTGGFSDTDVALSSFTSEVIETLVTAIADASIFASIAATKPIFVKRLLSVNNKKLKSYN